MEAKTFIATFSILDTATGIELKEFTTAVCNRSEYRAKLRAKLDAKSNTLGMTREIIGKRYGLTAKQLFDMMSDGVLCPQLNFFRVELKKWHVKA